MHGPLIAWSAKCFAAHGFAAFSNDFQKAGSFVFSPLPMTRVVNMIALFSNEGK